MKTGDANLNWISIAAFEAGAASEVGGVQTVVIPAGAELENVVLPAEANFFEDEFSGAAPVTFEWRGTAYTATLLDFMQAGGCQTKKNPGGS